MTKGSCIVSDRASLQHKRQNILDWCKLLGACKLKQEIQPFKTFAVKYQSKRVSRKPPEREVDCFREIWGWEQRMYFAEKQLGFRRKQQISDNVGKLKNMNSDEIGKFEE